MSDDHPVGGTRAAENEILYRRVNEHLQDFNRTFETAAFLEGEWACECADPACTTRVSASVEEYEAVRANPRTFMVAPGHVVRDGERVVRGNERFMVVEKVGAAGDAAEATDPRTD